MKTFIIAFIFIFLNVTSASSVVTNNEYWICHQTGSIDNQIVVAISPVFYGPDRENELLFEKLVKEQLKDTGFRPEFSARCESHPKSNHVVEHLKSKIKMFKKEGFRFAWISFPTVQ